MDLAYVHAVIHLRLSLLLKFFVKQIQITKLAVCKLRAQLDPEVGGKTDFYYPVCKQSVLRQLFVLDAFKNYGNWQRERIFFATERTKEEASAVKREARTNFHSLLNVCVVAFGDWLDKDESLITFFAVEVQTNRNAGVE